MASTPQKTHRRNILAASQNWDEKQKWKRKSKKNSHLRQEEIPSLRVQRWKTLYRIATTGERRRWTATRLRVKPIMRNLRRDRRVLRQRDRTVQRHRPVRWGQPHGRVPRRQLVAQHRQPNPRHHDRRRCGHGGDWYWGRRRDGRWRAWH